MASLSTCNLELVVLDVNLVKTFYVMYYIKDKRQLVCTSDNFRAITLGSIVAKLLMLLYYLRNKMLLQYRVCNLVLNKICSLLTAHML